MPTCSPGKSSGASHCATSTTLIRHPCTPVRAAASQVQAALERRHINVSVSRVGSTRLDFERRGLTEVLRASVHVFNTEQEIGRFLEAVAQVQAAAAAGDELP